MIELGVGFQGELTGRENIFLNAAIHGLARAEIERIYDAVVVYSGLGHFIDIPIKNYSSGMYMRLGFAIAANLDPDVLLLDEIFAVGDADFQQQCIATVRRFMAEGKTMVFVSHAPSAIRDICGRVCVLEEGQLAFDGDLEPGLAFYERILAQRVEDREQAAFLAAHDSVATPDESEMHHAPHRLLSGDRWGETGLWVFEFLRQQGLEPGHCVLDVGCGSLPAAVHLLPFLDEHHYWGLDGNGALVDAGVSLELPRAGVAAGRGHFVINDTFALDGIPHPFDVAVASSLFACLPFNGVARCIASVVRKLKPSGRFYATWFENPDAADFEPIVRPDGGMTYSDRQPYHYPFDLVRQVCTAVGATVERVADSTNPRGESVLVITPKSADGRR
jgi:energy-coupling factor transporter ATP-binding protein EcfA2